MAASNSRAAAKNELPAKPNAADVHHGTNKKLPQSGKPYAVQTVRPSPIRAIAVLNDSTMHRALRWLATKPVHATASSPKAFLLGTKNPFANLPTWLTVLFTSESIAFPNKKAARCR